MYTENKWHVYSCNRFENTIYLKTFTNKDDALAFQKNYEGGCFISKFYRKNKEENKEVN